MREVGSDDADSLKDYFYSMPPYHGVIGDFNFDEKGDVVGIKLRWLQVKDGEAQIIKN
jgi:hypothetical protein